jgi:predicted metal-dependent HD superfamily phosphohydrolase
MSVTTIQHFLVIYDIGNGRADVEQFGSDYQHAVAAYAAAERKYSDDSNYEVVLLGSDSFQTLERTHSSYFELAGKHADNIVGKQLADLGLV